MPEQEVSVQAKLVDMLTEPIKSIIELFLELRNKNMEHGDAVKELIELAGEYGRTQTDVGESVAVLMRGELETTEARQKAMRILDEIAGEYGVRQTDIMEELAGKWLRGIDLTKEQQEAVRQLTEIADMYGRTQTDISESVAVLVRGELETTEARQKAFRILDEIAGEFGVRQTDMMEQVAGATWRTVAAVRALRAEIEAIKSKTITITVIRKTVYKSEGRSSGGVSGGASAGSNPYSDNGGRPTLSLAEAKVFTEQTILPALKTLGREGKVEEVVH